MYHSTVIALLSILISSQPRVTTGFARRAAPPTTTCGPQIYLRGRYRDRTTGSASLWYEVCYESPVQLRQLDDGTIVMPASEPFVPSISAKGYEDEVVAELARANYYDPDRPSFQPMPEPAVLDGGKPHESIMHNEYFCPGSFVCVQGIDSDNSPQIFCKSLPRRFRHQLKPWRGLKPAGEFEWLEPFGSLGHYFAIDVHPLYVPTQTATSPTTIERTFQLELKNGLKVFSSISIVLYDPVSLQLYRGPGTIRASVVSEAGEEMLPTGSTPEKPNELQVWFPNESPSAMLWRQRSTFNKRIILTLVFTVLTLRPPRGLEDRLHRARNYLMLLWVNRQL